MLILSAFPQRSERVPLLLLLSAAVVPFLPLFGSPLLLDERVLSYEAAKFIALDPFAPWQLPLGGSGTWRPLLTYVYWLDGAGPAWLSHLFNLGLHALLVCLAWRWMCCRLTREAATIAACLFGCHAAHVASAGWVAGRADLLMTLFVVVALLAWEARRALVCVLAAVAAVLCKETGVAVLPMLGLLVIADGGDLRRQAGRLGLVVCGVLPVFVLSAFLAEVDPWYWPAVSSFQPGNLVLLPAFAVEVVAPLFRPIGLGHGLRDLFGCLLALPLVVVFIHAGRRCARRNTWRLGIGLAVVSLLPVLHVLHNDGGQWYLLIATLGSSLAWGALVEEGLPRRRLWIVLVLLLALFSLWESSRWRMAAHQVDEMVEKARLAAESSGSQEYQEPATQDPRQWPHMGPSFCCGLPYQVLRASPKR